MKQFHENYGYDLKGAVSKFAVKEMGGGDKEKALMQSLMKGNVQAVNIEGGAGSVKMIMEANLQFKNVTLYGEGMKRVPKEELEKYVGKGMDKGPDVNSRKELNGKEVAPDKGKEVKQAPAPEGEGAPTKKRT